MKTAQSKTVSNILVAILAAFFASALLTACAGAPGVPSATSGSQQESSSPEVAVEEQESTPASESANSASQEALEEAAVEEPSGEEIAMQAYRPVLDEYARTLATDEIPGILEYVNPEAWTAAQEWVDIPLSFALADLANDGTPELVVAYNFGQAGNGSGTSGSMNTYRVYDLYGVQDGQPVRLVDSASLGYRATVSLYNGGYIVREGSGGAMDIQDDYYYLAPDSASLEFLEGVHIGENGLTATYADGSTQEGAFGDELRTQAEHFDVSQLLEGLDWHFVSDYEAVLGGAVSAESSAGEVAREDAQSGQVLYYLTTLTPENVQSLGFSGNTFEITARFAVSENENPSYSDLSDSFEQLSLTVMDGTYYYGVGGLGALVVYTREDIESNISNTSGLGIVLKVQSGALLELRLVS